MYLLNLVAGLKQKSCEKGDMFAFTNDYVYLNRVSLVIKTYNSWMHYCLIKYGGIWALQPWQKGYKYMYICIRQVHKASVYLSDVYYFYAGFAISKTRVCQDTKIMFM